jgi:hypothetical protein
MSLLIWAPDLVVPVAFGVAVDGTLARPSCATDP